MIAVITGVVTGIVTVVGTMFSIWFIIIRRLDKMKSDLSEQANKMESNLREQIKENQNLAYKDRTRIESQLIDRISRLEDSVIYTSRKSPPSNGE